jgi:quercetin dioxygenase-like cupin family protein
MPMSIDALLLMPLGSESPAAYAVPADDKPIYANLQGRLLLDNSRVTVQQYVIEPGQSTGRHTSRGEQLLVFINGGVLRSNDTGRSSLWRDGRVVWFDGASPDQGSTNVGSSAIKIDMVTLKPLGPAPLVPGEAKAVPGQKPKYQYLNYPNIPGEDVLENDWVIVQRFTVNPGQWEGVHAHHPDMLYIHIKGGQWAARSKSEPEHAYPEPSPDGEVGWMPTIDISEGHESRNIGKDPIDLVWVTLKK